MPGGHEPPAVGHRTTHRRAVLAILSVSLLVVSIDTTILNVAIPDIIRSLRASSSDLQWVLDIYAIVFAGLLLVFGSMGDRLGRKWMLVAGISVFGAGSAASAFSGSPVHLIAARGIQGIGAAAIMPSTLSVLTNVFTDARERAQAIGIWSGTTGLGVAVGPVAGGWLLAHYWWGSVFLVNVPICALDLVFMLWLVPNSLDRDAKRSDVVGAVLSTGGMGLLLWGIIDAPSVTWTSPRVLAALGAGAGLLGAFVLWEQRFDHPMLELSLFRSRRFTGAMIAMGLVIFSLMGGLFLLTQFLQFSLGFSAFGTGLRIAPIALLLLVAAPLSIRLDRKFGTKPVVFTGMGLVATGFAMLSFTTVHGGYAQALPAFVVIGIGVGFAFAPCTNSVMGSVPVEKAGIGSATNSASLQVGGALGVAVLGSLLNTRYQDDLSPVLSHAHVPPSILSLIEGSLGGAMEVAAHVGGALGAALASQARLAFTDGLDLAVSVAACVVGLSSLAVLAILPNRAAPPGPQELPPGPGAGDEPRTRRTERAITMSSRARTTTTAGDAPGGDSTLSTAPSPDCPTSFAAGGYGSPSATPSTPRPAQTSTRSLLDPSPAPPVNTSASSPPSATTIDPISRWRR
jgi:EmrB/QacA subfamily drug resistance transporter